MAQPVARPIWMELKAQADVSFFGPIVIMTSWVRVRPVLKNGVPAVFAETRTSFQVGFMLPLDTIMNFISMLTVSVVSFPGDSPRFFDGPLPHPADAPEPESPDGLDPDFLGGLPEGPLSPEKDCGTPTECNKLLANIAPTSQSLMPKSLSNINGELEAGFIPLLLKGSFSG